MTSLLYGDVEYWQSKHHFYTHPLCKISCILAQTAAFQLRAISQKDRDDAWKKYLAFVKQGGSKTFTELLEIAGLKSPFDESCLKEVCGAVEKWLDEFDIT